MNDQEMLKVALKQSAIDMSCSAADFLAGQARFFTAREDARARKYLPRPLICELVSYGRGLVVSGRADVVDAVRAFAEKYRPEECLTFPAVDELTQILRPLGLLIGHSGMYFLPEAGALKPLSCPLTLRLLKEAQFQALYLPQWENALCARRRELDRLCVGAFDGKRLVGLAGASADAEEMWQIGVDVLPDYRGQGIAAAITSNLALAVLERGKVPFYGCLWANVASQRNALRCGFRPAWMNLSVKERKP